MSLLHALAAKENIYMKSGLMYIAGLSALIEQLLVLGLVSS